MTRPLLRAALPGIALLAAPASHALQRPVLGPVSIVRQVQVGEATRGERDFAAARNGVVLSSGESLRTLKRSYAALSLGAGAEVRLDVLTTVRIDGTASAPKIALDAGAVLVSGGDATVDAGVATVSGKDARFTVRRRPTGVEVQVLVGSVTVARGDRRGVAKAGETFSVAVDGSTVEFGGAEEIPPRHRPTELGGVNPGWWQALDRERGVAVFPGSEAAWALRTSPLTETVAQMAAIPRSPSEIAKNPEERARLLAIARSGIVPKIEQNLAQDGTLTLGNYVDRYGTEALRAHFGVGGDDLAFLLNRGVGNVAQVFQALGETGAGFGIDIRSVRTRSVYRPSSLEGAPNPSFRFMDGTAKSAGLSLAAMAIGAALDARSASTFSSGGTLSAFGLTADPQALGARGAFEARLGKGIYRWEANVTRLLSGPSSQSYENGDSVLSVERPLSGNVSVWAGRRRFVAGPVFQNQVRSQLLADRYTGAGATLVRGDTTFDAAWLLDANPDAMGRQAGGLLAAKKTVAGGIFGAQVIRVPELAGGTGFTVNGAYPVAPGQLDLYGEFGRGPDSAALSTVGAYFPSLFQTSDIDLFLEFGHHQGVGRAFSAMASRDIGTSATVRVFGHAGTDALGRSDTGGGVALLVRYGVR